MGEGLFTKEEEKRIIVPIAEKLIETRKKEALPSSASRADRGPERLPLLNFWEKILKKRV